MDQLAHIFQVQSTGTHQDRCSIDTTIRDYGGLVLGVGSLRSTQLGNRTQDT